MRFVTAQIMRDILLAIRGGAGWFHSIFFFIVFAGMGAIAIGPERAALVAAAPGLVWLGFLISLQVSASELFRPDMEDGTLAIIASEQESLSHYVLSRLLAVGVTTLVPMVLLSLLFYLVFGVTPENCLRASILLLIAAPSLLISCVVAAAISAGTRTGGLLGASLAAPLSIPVLIFGIGATERVLSGGPFFSAELMFLLAITLFYAVILPPFAVLSIRLGLE